MIQKVMFAVVVLGMTSGCAMSSNAPVTGGLYLGAKGGTTATDHPLGSKTGQSCATSYVGVVGLGDASIASAAKAGGITKIATVDSENTGILGVYAKNCTVVTGE